MVGMVVVPPIVGSTAATTAAASNGGGRSGHAVLLAGTQTSEYLLQRVHCRAGSRR